MKRHCFPVYWNGENRRVLRGHWFARKGGLDWFPLREDVAEQLEIAYRSQVSCSFDIFYIFYIQLQIVNELLIFVYLGCENSPSSVFIYTGL